MRATSVVFGVGAIALCSSIALAVAPMAMKWEGALKGNGESKITGAIAVMPAGDGKAEATVTFDGDTPGVTRPWHVHIGSCAKGGGVLGGGAAYAPIVVDDKGKGASKAMLPVAAPDTGSYYVNIHESRANMGSIVACGDLKMKH
jgi:superoxide dismutase, Cu-Zn family